MDATVAFAKEHVPEITGTIGLVTYALARNKLTLPGILAGIFVAGVHMLHPWKAFFWLLIIFFVLGTLVTRIGHKAKVHLTQSSHGGVGGEGPRSSAQVFANSGFASVLILLHAYLLKSSSQPFISSILAGVYPIGPHFPVLTALLPIGIVAQYAAVAADTFSSELGILARNPPFLITAPWRKVPKGTNGGVTVDGLIYGLLGSFLLVWVATTALYLSPAKLVVPLSTTGLLVASGLAGSIIDSLLGALLQNTITDEATGKVLEGDGGKRVMIVEGGGRKNVGGRDWLNNNGVNFVMAAATSLLAMGVASELGLRMQA